MAELEQEAGQVPMPCLWNSWGLHLQAKDSDSNLLLLWSLRYHSSATVLTLCKKGMDLPNLLQVPDVIYQVLRTFSLNLLVTVLPQESR